MKLSIKILIISLLVNLTSYSQTISLNTKKTPQDTVYSVSIKDITTINHIVVDLDACNELADSLWSMNKNYELVVKSDSSLIYKLEESESNLTNQLNLHSEMLNSCDKQNEKKDKKIKFLKFTRNLLICTAGLEAAYIGFKLLISN